MPRRFARWYNSVFVLPSTSTPPNVSPRPDRAAALPWWPDAYQFSCDESGGVTGRANIVPAMTANASPVTIREFQATDADGLRSLWTEVGFRLIGDDDAGLARFAERNPGLFLVAEHDGRIVGSTMGAWDGRRGWLYHVAVTHERRRSGLASDLVRRVEDGLAALGCARVLVLVEESNGDALAFWQSRGYETRSTRQLAKAL